MDNNFEYANATDAQLDEWLERACIEWQALQDTIHEEAIRKSYELQGLHNIY